MKPAKENQLKELFSRGVMSTIGTDAIVEDMLHGKKLRIKHGIDPSKPDLHLGYAAVYRKLKVLQGFGNTIVFLIGDFTARFGDPTDKLKPRVVRSRREVDDMSKNYLKQLGLILDIKKVEIRRNSEWYEKMRLEDFFKLISHFTTSQLLERDMFQRRLAGGGAVGAHELLYPILQGYDSVMLKSDLTIIGEDQLFNELRGRDLQTIFGQKPQAIAGMELLVGLDGTNKMSQSLGNYISLTDVPFDIYGKLMSLPDSAMPQYYRLLTDIEEQDIKNLEMFIAKPTAELKNYKERLAFEIVKWLHGKKQAQFAQEKFRQLFTQKSEVGVELPILDLKRDMQIIDIILLAGITSKSEARRLLMEKAVEIDGDTVLVDEKISYNDKSVLKIGKKKLFRIKITN